MLLIVAILFGAARVHTIWRESRPLSVQLRSILKESGFEVPEYVSDVTGSKGIVDFQGDYPASVSFSLRPDDIDRFMTLSPKLWKDPAMFQPLETDSSCGEFVVPAGSFLIEEWSSASEYMCRYAVDKRANRVYFYRASW